MLSKYSIETPLGTLIAIADEKQLRFLDFSDRFQCPWDEKEIPTRKTSLLNNLDVELQGYFEGKRREFSIPLAVVGTPFQQKVWQKLQEIPYGKTLSYQDVAKAIGRPGAYRAVGSANGANRFPILLPCHRVINANGLLGGYNCGLSRKKWLLDLEMKHHSLL